MASFSFPDLSGRSIFVTGGGAGIGAALTEGFVRQGARVAFVQRSDATVLCDRIGQEYGQRPLFLQCDITDTGALRNALFAASEAHGPIQVLVNNAANDQRHSCEEMSEYDWNTNLTVNLSAYFFAIQAVVPQMRQVGGGAVINFSSISYMMGNTGYPAYVTANAGITGMTRALAREFGPDRIRVNALMPGWVLTERQNRLWAAPDDLAAHLEKQCLKEHLKPEDIVGGTLFLASEASRMMTGQALVIDGGVVATG